MAKLFTILKAIYRQVKVDAGWHRLRLPTLITTALAMIADFVKPVVWIVPSATVIAAALLCAAAAIYLWLRHAQAMSVVQLPARAMIVSGVAAFIFGSVWAAQSAVAPDETVTGQMLRGAVSLQDSLKDLEEGVAQITTEVSRVRELMEEGAAREALARAQETRDYADHGQVRALEAILARGGNLTRADLSGMELTNVDLSEAQLNEARLAFSRLAGARLAGARLQGALLTLSTLERGDLSRADLGDANLMLVRAEAADFREVSAERANFSAADLRGANFRHAALRAARFAFADLTGADFTGADLAGALLIGAKIDGATFDDATLSNTDVTGITEPALMAEAASGLCRTYLSDRAVTGAQGVQVVVIERIPSSRFSGGIEYSRLLEDWFYYDASIPEDLPHCAERPYAEEWQFPIWRSGRGEHLSEFVSFSFSQEFLAAGGRRPELTHRVREQLIGSR